MPPEPVPSRSSRDLRSYVVTAPDGLPSIIVRSDEEYIAALEREVDDLLHAMHDASKFADHATKAILEGTLHGRGYAGREGPHRGTGCDCPHCVSEAV